ncbi:DNA cytosine methyltransferase [Halopseudomonas bauzanensis]|uniref:DNA (cytosine-5-)-methyltransferase n=1 Tax=Halopseudomonas bauzanensis TaxID=653930 RepID=A0A4U0YHD8_9GAMM|nr:DNA cytosine methyltransferase [Halopseudomonas bauzanensis]TKA89416.1 DNA cytosine methyltransferase [Halopseudomonas bauzanensis]
MRFIDVFAGCGGLSLGLLKAGCEGVIAIEKNPMAFETLRHNLIDGERHQFDWPAWLPKQAMSCEDFIDSYASEIVGLRGTIDLMVGGPPCQGFSTAGRRNPTDPRNKMAEQYLELVKLILPTYIVIENVSGFNIKFNEAKNSSDATGQHYKKSYADFIADELELIGYNVSRGKVNCADFGVPQNRYRYLIICSLRNEDDLLSTFSNSRSGFLTSKGLPVARPVSVYEAIADLQTNDRKLVENQDSGMRGFLEAIYEQPEVFPPYLAVMRQEYTGAPNSRRLPRHKPETIVQFSKIQRESTPGRSLSKEARQRLGLKKHAITVLTKNSPSPTITTLPDDIIHYNELRILTARETARIQSFPDWYEFTGKYTTGGKSRKNDCPRYTQIGNAVPPLLSEALGCFLIEISLKASNVVESNNNGMQNESS